MIRIENLSVSYKKRWRIKDISLVLRTLIAGYWSKWCWKINFIKRYVGSIHMKVQAFLDDKVKENLYIRLPMSSKIISTTISLSKVKNVSHWDSIHLSRFHTLKGHTGKGGRRLLKSLDFRTITILISSSGDNSNVCWLPAALCRKADYIFLDERSGLTR